MPSSKQVQFVANSLADLWDNLFREGGITREERLALSNRLQNPNLLRHLAKGLFGPRREARIPGIPSAGIPPIRVVLLSLREIDGSSFDFLAFRQAGKKTNKTPRRCFIAHRFTPPIASVLRWNLQELFGLHNIKIDYIGFDGAAVNLLPAIDASIRSSDFCFFDNRDTSNPSKPNVYIEAGMAIAYGKPFIFCHYRKDVWPTDFADVLYLSYAKYRELFATLYFRLPLFLKSRVAAASTKAKA